VVSSASPGAVVMKRERLEQQLKVLPRKPGVYLLKDGSGGVLYVGKGSSLRNRVRSYFGTPNALSPKLRRMVAKVEEVDFIVTDSEQEAIILECNLIKKHRPRYNVRLKDDKSYPYLKISVSEDWPRIYITRRFQDDGARYFGPFASARSLRKTLDLVKKLFPYRSCNRNITGTDARPCLEYHIHRCLGPCIGAVTREEYQEVIKQVILFLEGRQEQVVRELRRKMEHAAQELRFEKAAFLRDQFQAVERVMQSQKMVSTAAGDEDVIAFARDGDQACVQVFFVRGGKVIGREHFILEGTQDEEPGQVMNSFLQQFYGSAPYVPPQILLQAEPDELPLIEAWLEEKKGSKVRLRVPQRGERKKLVDMVQENAGQILEQLKVQWLTDIGKTSAALEEVQEQLNLPRLPERIECYDISDIRGTAAVGSMVVFENGRPKPSAYRRFKIKAVTQIDDYAMIREVLSRRFKRAGVVREEKVSWGTMPDLVLIDGGRGHLNSALEVLEELEIDFVPIASIAKENEEIFVPEVAESIVLPRNSQALYLLQRIRDEAHRFALAYHQRVRKKEALTSGLDGVPGIGPKRRRALLKKFRSVQGIKDASVDDLAAAPGMTRKLAQKVKEHL
jgi:excinuclease ABC subunit C